MVRGVVRVCCLAQSGLVPKRKNASPFHGCHYRYSRDMVVAETSVYFAFSRFGTPVWVLHQAGWRKGWILGSYMPILGGAELPVGLLHSRPDFRLACWSPSFVGLHSSVVAFGVSR